MVSWIPRAGGPVSRRRSVFGDSTSGLRRRVALAVGALGAMSALGGRTSAAQGVPQTVRVRPDAPSLPEVVAYALRRNPDVITAQTRIDSAHGEQRIARSFQNPSFTTIPGVPTQYSLSQNLDIGPDRLFRTRAAGQGSVATRYDYADQRRQVVYNVRQSYYDLLLTEALAQLASDQRARYRQLLAADSLRYRVGDLPRKDVATSLLNLVRADAAVARAAANARAARIALQLLMGVPHPDTAFRVRGALRYQPIALPRDSLMPLALASRPDVAAAEARTRQSRLIRALVRSLLIPVPGIGAVYQPGAPFESGRHYAFAVSFSVPLVYTFTGERERAAAGVQAADVASQRATRQAESDVEAAADNFDAARLLAERYATGLLAQTREALDMQRYAYQQGAASLLELLDAIRAFGDIQTDYYTSVHDYWVAAFAIDRAVGRDLVLDTLASAPPGPDPAALPPDGLMPIPALTPAPTRTSPRRP